MIFHCVYIFIVQTLCVTVLAVGLNMCLYVEDIAQADAPYSLPDVEQQFVAAGVALCEVRLAYL